MPEHEHVDQGLRGQSQEALSRYREDESLLDRDATESAGIAEVLAANGSVVESSPAGLPPVQASLRRPCP